MRRDGGRPSRGMQPAIRLDEGEEITPAVTVLLVERQSADSTALFRHICRKTQDPRARYRDALAVLAESHYMRPRAFRDAFTATFAADSAIATRLLAGGRCALHFEQYSQRYRLPCAVSELAQEDDAWQATYWHNAMFNPALPPDVRVLLFTPDWLFAEADPAP